MLVAVISDIHGNLPALESVLEDVDRADPAIEQVWCLGDVVGYGASPDECTALVAQRSEICLVGNHDLVVRGDLDTEHFAHSAGVAARWTAKRIKPETRTFLDRLHPRGQIQGVGLYHASPRDPVWEYVLSYEQARACLDLQRERVCLIGHSHVALHFNRDETEIRGEPAAAGTELDLAGGEWLVNPGSVGQPRDGDWRAAYLTLDTDVWSASFRRIEYPVDSAAEAILAAGLPRELALRLYAGQ
jgi:predicted phosphodiesterase